MSKHFLASVAAIGLVAFAAPAMAQDATTDAPAKNVMDGDHITVGVAAVYGPSYKGSDDGSVGVGPLIMGQIKGVRITPRAGGAALDFIPKASDAKVSFSLGPVATVSFARHSGIKDAVVRAAGKLRPAIEVGANGGVNFNGLLNPYDQLTISADVKWDVNGAYGGMVWQPGITYATPLSKAVLATVNVNAHHADDDYARYYYSVNATQSARSGLPQYNAKGGWDSAGATALVGWDLSGDIRDGGFAVFAVGNYTRMLNDGKDTPFTSIRGRTSQWTVGGGVAYTF